MSTCPYDLCHYETFINFDVCQENINEFVPLGSTTAEGVPADIINDLLKLHHSELLQFRLAKRKYHKRIAFIKMNTTYLYGYISVE